MSNIIQFDADQAKVYGLHEAIMLYKMIGFTRYHAANGTNFYDGLYWVYNSVKGWQELMDFMTDNQVRRTLESLVEQGALLKGNYNKKAMDRMLWYAVNPEVIAIWQNCQMQMANLPNAIGTDAKCIIGTNKTTNKTTDSESASGKQNEVKVVVDKWNATMTINPQVMSIHDKRSKAIIARIAEHGLEKVLEVIDKVEASDYLGGRKRGKWCSFDWVMRQDNFVSILEGTYDGGGIVSGTNGKQSGDVTDRYKIVKGGGENARYESMESEAPLGWVSNASAEASSV